jgi:hypothetical protein
LTRLRLVRRVSYRPDSLPASRLFEIADCKSQMANC